MSPFQPIRPRKQTGPLSLWFLTLQLRARREPGRPKTRVLPRWFVHPQPRRRPPLRALLSSPRPRRRPVLRSRESLRRRDLRPSLAEADAVIALIKFPVASFAANHAPDEAEVGVGGRDPIGRAVAANRLGDPVTRPAPAAVGGQRPSSSQAGRAGGAVARPRHLRPKLQTLDQCRDRCGKGSDRGRFGARGGRRRRPSSLRVTGCAFNSRIRILLGTDRRYQLKPVELL